MTIWFGLSAIVFGILLYFPLRKFMLSIAINKRQRKLKRALTDDETEPIKKRMYIIAAGVAMTFAFIYTKIIMFRFMGGGN